MIKHYTAVFSHNSVSDPTTRVLVHNPRCYPETSTITCVEGILRQIGSQSKHRFRFFFKDLNFLLFMTHTVISIDVSFAVFSPVHLELNYASILSICLLFYEGLQP